MNNLEDSNIDIEGNELDDANDEVDGNYFENASGGGEPTIKKKLVFNCHITRVQPLFIVEFYCNMHGGVVGVVAKTYHKCKWRNMASDDSYSHKQLLFGTKA
ncbi:hypothetical protein H5410_015853 [Solanum commersonii]|uniref:Uncharacterized protein n=1 Tax=Solanum commersonii TaxID=4109 RepID=A0A9J5ZUM6_SOLCO|nr:hypothetical protein H5410_015853 [Solanum commersonii]